ncbi:MAG: DNA repair protein RecO [Lachnospiraceae bacterium]|nr:DNA repair protein RecO [Lachnospiraceae bacterium]
MIDLSTEKVTGIVLKAEPIGEYDRRIVLLTGEKGKIAAFAKGARRQNSRLLLATNPFSFGIFTLYHGRSSFNLSEAEISNFFPHLRSDFEAAFYGMYFLELMDYYTRENNDEKMMLNLLYQALKALSHQAYDNRLIRYVFEIKALSLNGEYPGPPKRVGKSADFLEPTIFALDYITSQGIEKLFNFQVLPEILAEIAEIADIFRLRFIDKSLKSLEILESLSEPREC